MLELTGVNYNTGEQNKVMSKARQARDWKDTLAVVHYVQERNPFSNDPSLRNIATGVHAHPTGNVDTAHIATGVYAHRIVNVDTAHSVGATVRTEVDGGENK